MEKVSIQSYLRKQNYSIPDKTIYSHISEWLEWYRGEVEKFHSYKVYNGSVAKEEKRFRLGMAKKICEDWASLILNEKVAIKAGNYSERLEKILESNNFRVRGNQLVELAFALGTGALVEYKNKEDVVIDYLRADMIYPLSWDNMDVTECAFGSFRVHTGKECIYLQIHRFGKEDAGEMPEIYYIQNVMIDAESGEPMDLPDEVEPLVNTGSARPMFQIITPNIINNIDLDSPLGISVYGNAIDQLKGCDLIYDSYINEFILGKKRILVPISAAKMQMQKDGITEPTFDPDDNVYFQMPADRFDSNTPVEIDMTIRAQEHELGIQRSLDMLSLKSGMGTGRYQFNSTGVKTATEVISDKSDLFQNLKKHEIIIKVAIVNMVKMVAFLDSGIEDLDVSVDFDDSVIEDVNSTIDRNIKLINAELRSKKAAIMEINKYSEAEAKKELDSIAEDKQIIPTDIDWTDMENQDTDMEVIIIESFRPADSCRTVRMAIW